MSFGAKYLRRPDRFPHVEDSEPWGECQVALDLPGGPYHFTGLSAAQLDGVRAAFPGAVAAGAAAGATAPCRLLRAAAGDFLPVDTRGWEYAMDADWQPQAVRFAGLGLLARLDWKPGLTGGALWTCEDGGARFPGVFENFLRILVAYRLVEIGGVVLHSAGVVKNGAAFLFLGRSGAGKTTISRLSLARGGEVLSDDLNALFPAPGGCEVRQLPFTGDLGERGAVRRAVPLGALVRLEQDTLDAVSPLPRARALACLLACSPFVNVDPYRRDRLEGALLALLAAARRPALALRFSLGGGFWSIIDAK